MFLANMTDKEFLQEFDKERQTIEERSKSFWFREGRRKIMKGGKFPAVVVFETKSKRGNSYIVTIHASNKHNFKRNIIAIAYTVMIPRDVEPMIINFSLNRNGYYVERFYGHFFRRYRERLKLKGTTKDLVKRYMKYNNLAKYAFLEKDKEGQHFQQTCEEGASFGVITPEGKYLVKTFIPMKDLSTSRYIRHKEEMVTLMEAKEYIYGEKSINEIKIA